MYFEKVKKIVCSEMNVDESKVTLEASIMEDLGADSLDAVELIMALEDEFGLELTDEQAKSMVTIGDIVKFLEENVK